MNEIKTTIYKNPQISHIVPYVQFHIFVKSLVGTWVETQIIREVPEPALV